MYIVKWSTLNMYVYFMNPSLYVQSRHAWKRSTSRSSRKRRYLRQPLAIYMNYLSTVSSWLRYRTNRPVCYCPRSRRPCVFGPASSVSASAPARWPPPRSGSLSRVVGRSPPRFVSPARPDLPYPAHSGSLPYRPGSRPYRPASTGRCCCRRPLLRPLSRRG